MKLIDEVINLIDTNREKKFNCIPFYETFPRFSKFIPGIEKGMYYAVTGSPGSGKTQFTDHTFMYRPFDMIWEGEDISFDITYFSFEMGKQAKIYQGISKRLFDKYGIRVSTNLLQSIGSSLSEEVQLKIKDCRDYFAKLEEYVTFYDEPMTPTQIARVMEQKFKENGFVEDKIVQTASGTMTRVPGGYVQTNPNKYLIFIFDHISLIQPSPGQTLHQALAAFSSNNVHFRNKYRATIVNVHQQAIEGSIEQFTLKGDNVISKVEPQLALLGDNRTLGRDYDKVFGMFSPFRYEIGYYRGYKTLRLKDNCRFLSVLKNRQGVPDVHIGLYFDGMINYFEELPKSDTFTIIKNGVKSENELLYEKYSNGLVGILDTDRQRKFNFS
jgi:hypothetical protein